MEVGSQQLLERGRRSDYGPGGESMGWKSQGEADVVAAYSPISSDSTDDTHVRSTRADTRADVPCD